MKAKLAVLCATLILVSFAQADTYTWTGDATNLYWSTSYNWHNGNVPVAGTGTDIVLNGDRRNSSYANISNLTLNSITSQNSNFGHVVSGYDIALNSGINSTSGSSILLQNNLELLNEQTWNTTNNSDISIRGEVSGTNININKIGNGTLSFTGYPDSFDNFSGSLTLTEGTLNLARNNIVGSNLNMVMNGGTIETNGYNETFGTLTLTADSTISFSEGNPCNCGGDNSSIVHFSDSSSISWNGGSTLYVSNWDGSLSGGGLDQFYVGNSASGLNAQQLSQIKFFNPNGVSGIFDARILATGEIVPVPEPATMALGGALAGLLGLNERRRRKAKADEDDQK